MGRHSAPRSSLRSTLGTTARQHAQALGRTRRTAVGTGAALAAVALTAGTATASLLAPSGSSPVSASTTPTPAPATTTGSVGTVAPTTLSAPVTVADPETLDAASDVLVRAEYLTREQGDTLSKEHAAEIEKARARLSQAVSATQDPAGTLASVAPATDDAAQDDTATDDAAQDETVAAEGVTGRDDERASRSTERTRLEELAAPLSGVPTLAPPVTASVDPETSGDDAATDEPAQDAGTADEKATKDAKADKDEKAGKDASAEKDAKSDEDAKSEETEKAADAAEAAPTSEEEISTLTAELRTLLDASEAGVSIEVVPGPPSAEEVAAQLDEWAQTTEGYGNGQIPDSVLCELAFAPGQMLRCDAAHQIEALNEKYRKAFGSDISVTDSYRSYGSQVSVKASRGYFAAVPGTSNHGWGLALDLGGGLQSYGTAQYEWMRANAPDFGWDNPEWARAGGSKNEPWHWEFGDLS